MMHAADGNEGAELSGVPGERPVDHRRPLELQSCWNSARREVPSPLAPIEAPRDPAVKRDQSGPRRAFTWRRGVQE
jgi:hypothetical protein